MRVCVLCVCVCVCVGVCACARPGTAGHAMAESETQILLHQIFLHQILPHQILLHLRRHSHRVHIRIAYSPLVWACVCVCARARVCVCVCVCVCEREREREIEITCLAARRPLTPRNWAPPEESERERERGHTCTRRRACKSERASERVIPVGGGRG